MSEISLTLNGKARTLEIRPGESLLDVLRNRCGIKSVKDACQPQGQCGCCLALVDDKPRVTCATPAERVAGRSVTTLEGVPSDDRALLAKSFVATAGLQCGYCTPGFTLRTYALVQKNASPTRAEISKAIDVHLCRCTGYMRIIDAVELYARAKRGEAIPEPQLDGGVGHPLQRFRGDALTLGERPFVVDLEAPGMLEGAIVQSAHPRAKVLFIDASRARAVEGVHAVITAEDVPGQRWYGLIHHDWPGFVAVGEEVRCVGDVIAAVAAADRHTAREAAKLVEIEYEALEPVLDPEDAIDAGAPTVNPTCQGNVLGRTNYTRGDVDEALANSAHVVTGTWQTQRIEHLFLEPESAFAVPRDDGRLHLYTQGQGVFDDQRQVAAFLDVPEDRVFVELVPNGGAFGGKEDMSIQAHAALLAQTTGKPVRVTLSREESIRMHPKRHPIKMRYTVGCNDDGLLTAIRAQLIGDSGA